MKTKHTPGPWYSDGERIWRRDPKDLYENGGGIAGDKPIAIANRGWYGAAEQGYPIEANARLIAAAPELLEAAMVFKSHQEAFDAGDDVSAMLKYADFVRLLDAAIAKATGE